MSDHVLVREHGAAPASQIGLSVQRGRTTHFVVSYDDTLGANGATLADAVLATCEADFATLQTYFGGITPNGLPCHINIIPGNNGAGHATCLDTTILVDAFAGTDANLVRMLVVAEVDEVFMANQNAGWDCGASNGEGLSRILATEAYPAELNGFATASDWLNDNSRPDWVTHNDPTAGTSGGYNPVSIGCSVLFINYLRYQLGYSFAQIVQAGGATLQQTYQHLTGDTSDPFGPFWRLLALNFPPGESVSLSTDNPFPLPIVLPWIGDFTGSGHAEVLFYSPGDGNWWLGSYANGQLAWHLISQTRDPQGINFGDTSHDPTWIGDFTGSGHAEVLFYSLGDRNWWSGVALGNSIHWSLAGTK